MQNTIINEILKEHEYLSGIRKRLHKFPELAFCETNTTKIIKDELLKYGVEILELDIETGVLGILKGEKEGQNHVIALRADMDALPIEEMNDVEYKSTNEGIMHACGHDGHVAMLLGAAKILANNKDKFSGVVKFIFQPAEEVGKGAKVMIESGVLEDPKVDTIIAFHSWPHLKVGEIGLWEGSYYAAADFFDVKIIGESGHGAYPHKSKDCLMAGIHAVIGLQPIITRQTDAVENTVISVCRFNAGTADNIIPQISNFGGTVRTHSDSIRKLIPIKMEKIIKGVSEMYDCDYEFTYNKGMPMVSNNPEVVRKMSRTIIQTMGEDYVKDLPAPVMGSEDFGEYCEHVINSAIFRIGNTRNNSEERHLHSEYYNFDDGVLPYGVNAFVEFVLRYEK